MSISWRCLGDYEEREKVMIVCVFLHWWLHDYMITKHPSYVVSMWLCWVVILSHSILGGTNTKQGSGDFLVQWWHWSELWSEVEFIHTWLFMEYENGAKDFSNHPLLFVIFGILQILLVLVLYMWNAQRTIQPSKRSWTWRGRVMVWKSLIFPKR